MHGAVIVVLVSDAIDDPHVDQPRASYRSVPHSLELAADEATTCEGGLGATSNFDSLEAAVDEVDIGEVAPSERPALETASLEGDPKRE
jgi:hypothetical protein